MPVSLVSENSFQSSPSIELHKKIFSQGSPPHENGDVGKAYRTREQLQRGGHIPDEVLDERPRDLQRVDLRRPRPHQAFRRHGKYAKFRPHHHPSIDILPCNRQNAYCVLQDGRTCSQSCRLYLSKSRRHYFESHARFRCSATAPSI